LIGAIVAAVMMGGDKKKKKKKTSSKKAPRAEEPAAQQAPLMHEFAVTTHVVGQHQGPVTTHQGPVTTHSAGVPVPVVSGGYPQVVSGGYAPVPVVHTTAQPVPVYQQVPVGSVPVPNMEGPPTVYTQQ